MLCWLRYGFNTRVFVYLWTKWAGEIVWNECRLLGKVRSWKIRIVSVEKNKVKRMWKMPVHDSCLNHSLSFPPGLFLLWPYETLTNFDVLTVFIESLLYGPLTWQPDHPPYSFSWTDTSTGLRIGPFSYYEDNNRLIGQRPHFPISSSLNSCCTPQFCYLRNSSTLLILVVLRSR